MTFHATAIQVGSLYGGGVVAYIFQSGDQGYVAGQCHGLIAALTDQSSGIVWALPANQSTVVGTTSRDRHRLANTTAIIAQNGAGTGYAAGLAQAYTGGSYSDWYLPSRDELNWLYSTAPRSTPRRRPTEGQPSPPPPTTGARRRATLRCVAGVLR